MFSETLRIKPVLDPGATKRMESTLSERFSRVSRKFAGGLKAAIKGSVLGISLALISKLLNPIEALEEKMKTLLGQGTDLRDLADQFNTTPGQIKRLQDVGQSLGVSPDQLKEMLSKFASAVEKARMELEDPTAQISASTNIVRNFAGEKDLAEGFFQFLQSLKAQGQGPGRDVFFGQKEQRKALERERLGQTLPEDERQRLIQERLLKHQTGLEARQANEKEIFGAIQSGAARRLIEANFPEQFKKLNEPSTNKLNNSINKVAGLADQQNLLKVKNDTQNFLDSSQKLNSKMITDMAESERLKNERDVKLFDSFNDLKKASLAIEELKSGFQDVAVVINKGIGYLADLASFTKNMQGSGWWRRLFGGNGK